MIGIHDANLTVFHPSWRDQEFVQGRGHPPESTGQLTSRPLLSQSSGKEDFGAVALIGATRFGDPEIYLAKKMSQAISDDISNHAVFIWVLRSTLSFSVSFVETMGSPVYVQFLTSFRSLVAVSITSPLTAR